MNAIHCPDRRKRMARKACAMCSGSTNYAHIQTRCSDLKGRESSHLVELVTQVNWVDIVTFQIREHYDLFTLCEGTRSAKPSAG